MIKFIKREELIKLMNSKARFKLIDVLDKGHYAKEHIPGAISLPLNEIESKAKKYLDKKDKIIVYCASFECQASTMAAEKLKQLGYEDVLDYKGGIKDYKDAGLVLAGELHEAPSRASACQSCQGR